MFSSDVLVQLGRSSNYMSPENKRDNSAPRESSRNRSSRSREGSPRIPRPRSEEIPLEDLRKSQNSSPVLSRPSSNNSNASQSSLKIASDVTKPELTNQPILINQSPSTSEETSFIANEEKSKRKGIIETV